VFVAVATGGGQEQASVLGSERLHLWAAPSIFIAKLSDASVAI
jgi:hypothetical protein